MTADAPAPPPVHAPEDSWHLRLFGKSIAKQAKLKALLRFLPPVAGKVCLDMGGDNGVISFLLRQQGGDWHSVDLNEQAVESIRALVKTNVRLTDGSSLPYPDGFFDVVVVIDFLEHIPHDRACVGEIARILRKGGTLIVNVPLVKKASVVRGLRNLLGLTDAQHGHVRPGYTMEGLQGLLGGAFAVTGSYTYSRFFTELMDTAIALGCAASAPRGVHTDKGLLITGDRFEKSAKQFRIYSLLYPFMRAFSRLDALLYFTRGYRLTVAFVKE